MSRPELEWQSLLYWFTVFKSDKQARLETYLELTREFNETRRSAARRMGISLTTAERYEADIRAAMEGVRS
jgi:hypothetical protein